MKRGLLIAGGIVFCFCLCAVSEVYAQDEPPANTGLKQEIKSDRQQIMEEHREMKQDAQAAKTEESQLRQQIQAAVAAGDTQTAKQLRAKLHAVHMENIQQKQEDKKDISSARHELRADVKEAHQEAKMFPKANIDNNPPGPKGGLGTNWKNPPGPKGGPGASPVRKHKAH